jgi:hypothetical protein
MLHRVPVPGEPQQQTCLWIAVGADEKIAKCIVEFARFQIFEEPDREPMTVSSAATASASLIGFLKGAQPRSAKVSMPITSAYDFA